MKKRAQGISMNTIVIAAIALIVLIVLVLIFTGQINKYRRGLDECKTGLDGTDCEDSESACLNSGGVPKGDCVIYNSNGERDVRSGVCCVTSRN
jgi:hypothetical protein